MTIRLISVLLRAASRNNEAHGRHVRHAIAGKAHDSGNGVLFC
jgi:hypothetical protein